MTYLDIPNDLAWKQFTTGGVLWVATHDGAGRANLAPVAWACPLDYEPTSQVLFVCDPKHHTLTNIRSQKNFALILPGQDHKSLVEQTGSLSGRDTDKWKALNITQALVTPLGHRIPQGAAGWADCNLVDLIDRKTSIIVIGEITAAQAVPEAWKHRLHLTPEDGWYRPGPLL